MKAMVAIRACKAALLGNLGRWFGEYIWEARLRLLILVDSQGGAAVGLIPVRWCSVRPWGKEVQRNSVAFVRRKAPMARRYQRTGDGAARAFPWAILLVVLMAGLPATASATPTVEIGSIRDLVLISSEIVTLEVKDPNGDPVVVTGTRELYAPQPSARGASRLLSAAACTVTIYIANPYYYYSGGHRVAAYGYLSVSAGCAPGGYSWNHFLQEREASWVTRVSGGGFVVAGGTDAETLTYFGCSSAAGEEWRNYGSLVGGGSPITKIADLSCNT